MPKKSWGFGGKAPEDPGLHHCTLVDALIGFGVSMERVNQRPTTENLLQRPGSMNRTIAMLRWTRRNRVRVPYAFAS
jgi:hypothetical protein